jgi:hypothetical protein
MPLMRPRVIAKIIACVGALLLSSQLGLAQFGQQGHKLTPNDAVGATAQALPSGVGVSADGNTAIVGGNTDEHGVGAALVYIRTKGAWTQQGSKLVGTGVLGYANQGTSVALSADGNTAIIGGPFDDGDIGAAWVFTRSNGVWTQQGSKLVGTGAVGNSGQGNSVALSADGNTAIVGGPPDDSNVGAVWVFTRSNGVWTQQGSKLVGTGATGSAQQGFSVALSGDGNTAAVGGPEDDGAAGAMWVFARSNGVWAQQGSKLVGTGAGSSTGLGSSVALSSDGTTAIVGGRGDSISVGAVWVFTRSNGVWTQQGSKLVGTGADEGSCFELGAGQGTSVALSGDGNTAIEGAPCDNIQVGAVWVFTRSNGVWTQEGSKLVGTGAVGPANQGYSVALSAGGNTAIVGGPRDNSDVGAAWVFVEPPFAPIGTNAHDFNDDGYSDIVWLDASGSPSIWLMNGTTATNPNTAFVGTAGSQWAVVGQRDFNGDGFADLLWRDTRGDVMIWEMTGTTLLNQNRAFVAAVPTNWSIVGTGNFNGDAMADILWQDTTGNVAIWEMDGTAILNQNSSFVAQVPGQWSIKGTGDFNGDGMSDILWQDTTGNVAIWEMNGTTILNANTSFVAQVPSQWSIKGTGDFNGDGNADILWQDTSGNVAIWEMNGTAILNANTSFVAQVPGQWLIQLTGDYNADGMSDILWQDTFGNVAIWEMNGTAVLNANSSYVGTVASQWSIQQLGAD